MVATTPAVGMLALPAEADTSSLFHHSLITSDFEQLTFHAAASLQLKSKWTSNQHQDPNRPISARSDHRLIVSSYNSLPHLLDLQRYDHQTRLLAKALTIMKPVRKDYATAAYLDSFNFEMIFAFLKELAQVEGPVWRRQQFYVVVFRSQLKPDADSKRLFDLDLYSHQEAMASGGLLKYWFGVPDDELRNLATCVWRSRADAYAGGKGPWHVQARAAAGTLYQKIIFTTYTLTIEDGVASWSLTDY